MAQKWTKLAKLTHNWSQTGLWGIMQKKSGRLDWRWAILGFTPKKLAGWWQNSLAKGSTFSQGAFKYICPELKRLHSTDILALIANFFHPILLFYRHQWLQIHRGQIHKFSGEKTGKKSERKGTKITKIRKWTPPWTVGPGYDWRSDGSNLRARLHVKNFGSHAQKAKSQLEGGKICTQGRGGPSAWKDRGTQETCKNCIGFKEIIHKYE